MADGELFNGSPAAYLLIKAVDGTESEVVNLIANMYVPDGGLGPRRVAQVVDEKCEYNVIAVVLSQNDAALYSLISDILTLEQVKKMLKGNFNRIKVFF